MLQNYIKIAWRNILRNKTLGFINIFGMAVGLSICFIIGLYVLHELSYDRFIPNADRVVRIIQKSENGHSATNPPGMASSLENELPAVEVLTNIDNPRRQLLGIEGESIYLDGVMWVDKFFLEVFPFQILRGGSGSEILEQPGKMLLTESAAFNLFGTEDPIGKAVLFENELEFEVAGIVKDPPPNFHFSFQVLLSLTTDFQRQQRYESAIQWNYWTGGYSYVRLKPGITKEAFRQQLTHFENQQEKPEWMDEKSNRLTAQALTDIHLARDISSEIAPQGNRTYVVLFSAIGLLILSIAGFNYMNLSVAKGITRSQEVGIRKVAGASRKELAGQFLGESVLMSLLSLPLALLLMEIFYPFIVGVIGIEFAYTLANYPPIILAALAVTVFTGLVAGSYPAFILSAMKPAAMFKNHSGKQYKNGFRKILVSLQFTISIILIIGTLVIRQQMQYVQQKQLGFDSGQVLTFDSGHLDDQYRVFKQELLRSPRILSVSSGPPMGIGHKNMGVLVEESEIAGKQWLSVMNTDYDYINLMGMKLKTGRVFSQERVATDRERAVVINESAAGLLGLGENPLGKTVTISDVDKEVIGVVEDFHNEALYSEITPVVFQLHPGNHWTGLVKLASGNLADGIKEIETVWSRLLPERPFEFTFLDKRIEAMYRQEQRLGVLFTGFASVAIIIAGLGLFGLATFMTTTRTKEIGIRKVLGASISQIVALLSKDFLKLVLIGFIIAVPIAWYAMNKWLADFAYRIEIGPGIFVIAGCAALLIALLTVSWQSVKAALMNPVNSLRSE